MSGVRISFGGLLLLAVTGCSTVSDKPSSGASYANPYPLAPVSPYSLNRYPYDRGSTGLGSEKTDTPPGIDAPDTDRSSDTDRKNMEILQQQEIHSQQTSLLGVYGGYHLTTSCQPGVAPGNGGVVYGGGTAGMPYP